MECKLIMVLFTFAILNSEALPMSRQEWGNNPGVMLRRQTLQDRLNNAKKQKEIQKAAEQIHEEKIKNLIKVAKDLHQDGKESMQSKAVEVRFITLSRLVTDKAEKDALNSGRKDLFDQAKNIKQQLIGVIERGRYQYNHEMFISKIIALMQQAHAISNQS